MKLIGNLKTKVDKANNKEEAKNLLSEVGIELTDDELEKVSGGIIRWNNNYGISHDDWHE